jgi:hypothetical protein
MAEFAVEVISFEAEIELKEEKVYVHLNEEKEHDAGTCAFRRRLGGMDRGPWDYCVHVQER